MSSKHAFWRYLKRFGAAEKKMKTMSLKHELSRYFKRFGTAENFLKTMSLQNTCWRYLKRLGDEENLLNTMSLLKHAFWWYLNDLELQRINENNVSKPCTVTVFKTIWNYREQNENKDVKWCILTVFETIWNVYVNACWCLLLIPILYCFDFIEKVATLGMSGLVTTCPPDMPTSGTCLHWHNFLTSKQM